MVAKDLLFVLFMLLVVHTGRGNILGDECDWTGSGLSSIPHTITPIYLRCPTGRIRWLYPLGALRVLLRLPSGKDFRACVRTQHEGPLPSPRLYLEAPRALVPLKADSKAPTPCFLSRGGQVALYVESSGEVAEKRVMELEYDLEISKGYDPNEECRPCTGEELAHAFCTSDLVTRGFIMAVENDYTRDISELHIRTTKLIRHATDDGYSNDIDNEIEDTPAENLSNIVVKVARHCGVNHGSGEFVFMARRKLGEMTLRCAPRLEDWKHLVHSLTEEGKSHCVLRI